MTLPHEILYLLLIFALMVVPRVLQRLRLPAPLSSFGLGMLAVIALGTEGYGDTLPLLATLGISSLFLFAGLEIEPADFAHGKWPLIGHLLVRALALLAVVFLAGRWLGYSWQVSALLALALLTPSTGFILDTLASLDLDEQERYWVRIKAVSGELFALVVLFVVLQSDSVQTLAWSSAALLAIVVGLPALYLVLGRSVIPYARGSEFSLLVMIGVVSAFATYKLGVYYLVGAFLAGFIARLLRDRLPGLASDDNLHAIQKFASFFVPFYFFYKGLSVPSGALSLEAVKIGALLTVVMLPLRVALVWTQRRFIKGESALASLRVAAALTPTLIFTLVLASILRERFGISDALYGGLLIYAGTTTLVPSLVMSKPVEFDLSPQPANPAPAQGPPRA
jgi:Kef-type K+ transport system membrane component KefB